MLSSEDPGLIVIKVFLSEGETPYLVHCLEGKDRTGFAIMVLEALMGWNATQITDDYMQTYANYYGIEPGTEKYDLIEEKNIREMLAFMTGQGADAAPEEIDLKSAAEAYLLNNGMDEKALGQLEAKLTAEGH